MVEVGAYRSFVGTFLLCAHVHVCICVHVYTCTHTCVHVCVCVCMCVCVFAGGCVRAWVCVRVRACVCVCVFVLSHICNLALSRHVTGSTFASILPLLLLFCISEDLAEID